LGHSLLLLLCCHAWNRRLSDLLPLLLLMRELLFMLLCDLLLQRELRRELGRCLQRNLRPALMRWRHGGLVPRRLRQRLPHSRWDRNWCRRDSDCGHARVHTCMNTWMNT
jgi:hypothetical protein